MPNIREGILAFTPPRQKRPHPIVELPHLIVKLPNKNEWESIAIITVPIHEFWQKLGTAMHIEFRVEE